MELVDRAAYGLIVIGTVWAAYRQTQVPDGRLGLVLLVGFGCLVLYIILSAFVLWPRHERKIKGE